MAKPLSEFSMDELRDFGYALEPLAGREVRAKGRKELTAEIIEAAKVGGKQAVEYLQGEDVALPDDLVQVAAAAPEVSETAGDVQVKETPDDPEEAHSTTGKAADTDEATEAGEEGEGADDEAEEAKEVIDDSVNVAQIIGHPSKPGLYNEDIVPFAKPEVLRLYPHRTMTLGDARRLVAGGMGRWNFLYSTKTKAEVLGK